MGGEPEPAVDLGDLTADQAPSGCGSMYQAIASREVVETSTRPVSQRSSVTIGPRSRPSGHPVGGPQ
jgi:hypothetical protein